MIGDATDKERALVNTKFRGTTRVMWYLRNGLRRDHGIDFSIVDGKINLVLPKGKSVEDCVK